MTEGSLWTHCQEVGGASRNTSLQSCASLSLQKPPLTWLPVPPVARQPNRHTISSECFKPMSSAETSNVD